MRDPVPPLNAGNFTWEMPPGTPDFESPPGGDLLSNTTIDPNCPVNMTGSVSSQTPAEGTVTVYANGTFLFTAPNASWSGE